MLATASSCSLSSAMEGGSSADVGSALMVGVAEADEGAAGGGMREEAGLAGEMGSGLAATNTWALGVVWGWWPETENHSYSYYCTHD